MSWEDWSDGLGSPAGVLADLGATLEQAGARHLFVAAAGNAGERLREQPEGPPPPGPPTPGVPPPFFWMPAQLHADNMLVVAASGEQTHSCRGMLQPRGWRCCCWHLPACNPL